MLDFEKLYDKYWARIAYYVHKLVDNKEEAVDIAQESFIALSQHLDTIKDENHALGYLYLCAKNKSINYIKAVKQEHKRQPGYLYLSETSDTEVVEAELIAALFTVAERLPPTRLKIFTMLFFEGLKLQEVADMLHLSVNTIKSQRAKAIISLRKSLA